VTAVVVLTEGIELSEEELQIFFRQQITGYDVQKNTIFSCTCNKCDRKADERSAAREGSNGSWH